MKPLIPILSLALLIMVGVTQAETTTGTVTWNVADLQDSGGANILGVVLDYRYDPALQTVPVNGYMVVSDGNGGVAPVLVSGTAMLFGDAGILIYVNGLQLSYAISTDGSFNGDIALIDADGNTIDTGTVTLQP